MLIKANLPINLNINHYSLKYYVTTGESSGEIIAVGGGVRLRWTSIALALYYLKFNIRLIHEVNCKNPFINEDKIYTINYKSN